MTEFTLQVIDIIKGIPKGKVMTYGQIAANAGNPWGSRQVSRILHSMSSSYGLPWHRVINSKGEISLKGEGKFIQEELLFSEGIEVKNGKIDLNTYLHIIEM
ncbi:MGMT family protein [Mycoplasmatota bacterium WC30]